MTTLSSVGRRSSENVDSTVDMIDYTLVAETDSYTVVGSYTPVESDRNPLLYESEAALEKRFISQLPE